MTGVIVISRKLTMTRFIPRMIQQAFSLMVIGLMWIPNALAQSRVELVKRANESVVWVHAFTMPDFTESSSYNKGTGFCTGTEGYVITNHHVIGHAKTAMLFPNRAGKPINAVVLWSDSTLDLAVLKPLSPLPSLALTNSVLDQGEDVIVLGYPGMAYKPGALKVSEGIVSGNPTDSIIQITAPVNYGNSGGPCLNMRGEVVGAVFAKVAEAGIEGIAYLINADLVRYSIASARMEDGSLSSLTGTRSQAAFAKMMEAQYIVWQNDIEEDPDRKERNLQAARKTLLSAIEEDNSYAEARLFLASLFLRSASRACFLGEASRAEKEAKNFRRELDEAYRLKPTLRYSTEASPLSGFFVDNTDCEGLRAAYEFYRSNSLERSQRAEEWNAYLASGSLPKSMEATIDRAVSTKTSTIVKREVEQQVEKEVQKEVQKHVRNQPSPSGSSSTFRTSWDDYPDGDFRPLVPNVPVSLHVKLPLSIRYMDRHQDVATTLRYVEFAFEPTPKVRPIFGMYLPSQGVAASDFGGRSSAYTIGVMLGPVALRYTTGQLSSPLVHRWSADYSTKPPNALGYKPDVIWSFGVGQVSDFVLDPSLKGSNSLNRTFTARVGFEIKVQEYLWGTIDGAGGFSRREADQVSVGVAARL
jgi:hypothetical protein